MPNNNQKQPDTTELKIDNNIFEVRTKWLLKQVLPELKKIFYDLEPEDFVNNSQTENFLDYLEKEVNYNVN